MARAVSAKNGFTMSETIRPKMRVRRRARLLAYKLGWYLSCLIAARIRCRVSGFTTFNRLSTAETVLRETPARLATSSMVAFFSRTALYSPDQLLFYHA